MLYIIKKAILQISIISFIMLIGIINTPVFIQATQIEYTENILDGVISEEEYLQKQSIDGGKFILYWQPTEEAGRVAADCRDAGSDGAGWWLGHDSAASSNMADCC